MSASDLLGGRYELRGVLGRGGMAEVRDGWDTRLHRAVAIKLLHPGLIAQADTRMRFAAEARSAAALSHPNVVAVHDSGEHHGTPLIVMMRLSGRSLADYLTPERIAGRRATVSDDLYALGVVGYEALTAHRPFPQQNLAELARAIPEQPPPPLALLRPDVDPSLAETIERAMARDPQWRFGSATAMRAALAGELIPARPPTRVLAAPLPDPDDDARCAGRSAEPHQETAWAGGCSRGAGPRRGSTRVRLRVATAAAGAGQHQHVGACAAHHFGGAAADDSAGPGRPGQPRRAQGKSR